MCSGRRASCRCLGHRWGAQHGRSERFDRGHGSWVVVGAVWAATRRFKKIFFHVFGLQLLYRSNFVRLLHAVVSHLQVYNVVCSLLCVCACVFSTYIMFIQVHTKPSIACNRAQELHKRSAVPANVMQTLDTLPIVPWVMKLRMSSNSKPWMVGSILSS